jgi:hypothetical protein
LNDIDRDGIKKRTQRDIKHVLKPFGKGEWNCVSQVQRVTGRSSARIQEERFASFISIQNPVKVTVRKEESTSEPAVRLVTGKALESLEQGIVYQFGCPFSIVI